MTHQAYKQAIKAAKTRLRTLVEKRQQVEEEIEKLKKVIITNAIMLNADESTAELDEMNELLGQSGFTEVIRHVLSKHPERWFNAIGVRELLRDSGWPIGRYKNPLASIHTILKRLKDVERDMRDGEAFYRIRPEKKK
jgi:hypothetical protein